jgi:predicted Zn-dependent peptidase
MYEKTTLNNGLRIITSNMPHVHSVSLAVFVGAGSCYERDEEAGISHFAEHMLFKGTQRRPSAKEISQDIEGVGGTINGSTGQEMTFYWCKVGKDHFHVALDVLSDILLHSTFTQESMQQERSVIIEEINMNLDLPQQRVSMLIDELLWPEQPLGRDIAGSKDTVTVMTREQVINYVSNRYVPNNVVISIAGNIDHAEVVRQIESLLHNWMQEELTEGYSSDDRQSNCRVRAQYMKCEQTHICLAVHGLSQSHPQRFALDLLNTVLGGGMSSRLFTEIREKKGLAYDIHSYVDHFRDVGSFVVYAGVDSGKVETAIAAIIGELRRLREGVTEEEFVRARELTKGKLQLRMEDSQNIALWLGSQEILKRQILNVEEIISIVDSVTRDEMYEVAEMVIKDSDLNLAIVSQEVEEAKWLETLQM